MMTSDRRVEFPWWVAYLTFALTLGSLYMTGRGSLLVSTGWDPFDAYSLMAVFAICNIGAVALGYVGAENWSRGAKQVAAISLIIGLFAATLSGIGTMRALTNMFEQNKDALRVEVKTEASTEAALERAIARVQRAQQGIAPLESQAAIAEREFNREVASGFGDVSTQRKAEWDASLAKLTEARKELTAAEEHLARLEDKAGPQERSDAALVAAKTTEIEQTLQIWLGTAVIELLPMLSGWLFGVRVAAMADPMLALADRLGDLDRKLEMMNARPPAPPPVAAPKTKREEHERQNGRITAGLGALNARREALQAKAGEPIEEVAGEDESLPGWQRRVQSGEAKPVSAPRGQIKAPPRPALRGKPRLRIANGDE